MRRSVLPGIRSIWFRLGIGLLSVALPAACATPPPQGPADALEAAYADAVADARDAEAAEVVTELVRITPANPDLAWSPDGDRVLVVTWADRNSFPASGHGTRLGRDVWVTAVPELQRRCEAFPADVDRGLRVTQLLGLPLGHGYTELVELWVDPRDMFRPAPDPEIDDSKAELKFPLMVPDEHRRWFIARKEKSYDPPNYIQKLFRVSNSYPWTRLGYTYDWGNPASEVGLSEFVVKKGAYVTVKKVCDVSKYCLTVNIT